MNVYTKSVKVKEQDYPRAPGKYPPESNAFELLKVDLKRNGMKIPVFVSDDMTLLSGHYRFWAAVSLGWDRVPAKIIDNLDEVAEFFSF